MKAFFKLSTRISSREKDSLSKVNVYTSNITANRINTKIAADDYKGDKPLEFIRRSNHSASFKTHFEKELV